MISYIRFLFDINENSYNDILLSQYTRKQIEKHEKNNFIINVFSILVFVFFVDINIISIIIAMLITDVVLTLLEIFTLTILPTLKVTVSEEDIVTKVNILDTFLYASHQSRESPYNLYISSVIEKEKVKFKLLKDAGKNKEEDNITIKDKNRNKELVYFRTALKEAKDTKSNLELEYSKLLETSIDRASSLLREVEKKPDTINLISSTFNVHLIELIDIVSKISQMETFSREKYKEKLENLVVEFNEHLDKKFEEVRGYSSFNIDISIDVLLRELNSENEGKGEIKHV